MPGRPTKKRKPPSTPPANIDNLTMYRVCVGGRVDRGPMECFDTEGKARGRARKAFEVHLSNLKFYAADAKPNIEKAISDLNRSTFTLEPKRIGAVIDPTTHTAVVVTIWRGPKL